MEAAMPPVTLETPRLLLRPWREEDKAPFAALNADPEVMKYFPACLDREESDALAARMTGLILREGWGFWAVERKEGGRFIGTVGLNRVEGLPFAPLVEVGWRLDRPFWGRGYATEAARAAMDFAWQRLGEKELVAFTAVLNEPSQGVMRRLGMTRLGDFEHPRIPQGHPLRPHVLYGLRRPNGIWSTLFRPEVRF